jgi:hypothetical protein
VTCRRVQQNQRLECSLLESRRTATRPSPFRTGHGKVTGTNVTGRLDGQFGKGLIPRETPGLHKPGQICKWSWRVVPFIA